MHDIYKVWMPIQGVSSPLENCPNYYYSTRPLPVFGKVDVWVFSETCTLTLNNISITRDELERRMEVKQKKQDDRIILWGLVSGKIVMRGDDPDHNDWSDKDVDFSEPSSDRDLPVEFILVASEIHFYEDPAKADAPKTWPHFK